MGKNISFWVTQVLEKELIKCGPYEGQWKVLETMKCGKLWNEIATFGLEKKQPASVCKACLHVEVGQTLSEGKRGDFSCSLNRVH